MIEASNQEIVAVPLFFFFFLSLKSPLKRCQHSTQQLSSKPWTPGPAGAEQERCLRRGFTISIWRIQSYRHRSSCQAKIISRRHQFPLKIERIYSRCNYFSSASSTIMCAQSNVYSWNRFCVDFGVISISQCRGLVGCYSLTWTCLQSVASLDRLKNSLLTGQRPRVPARHSPSNRPAVHPPGR